MHFLLLFLALLTPFKYELALYTIPGKSSRTMICFHGMGGNWQTGIRVKAAAKTDLTVISFNFPDHDMPHTQDAHKTTFGTINEILPAIWVLKTCICDQHRTSVDLYGYSAGGGALINTLALLNSDINLEQIGVGAKEKKSILDAVQKGWILLDTPLKSCEELTAFRDESKLQVVAKRYAANNMEPIKNIEKLHNLALNVIIHFQNPDSILSNRDDLLFIQEFNDHNTLGVTYSCIGHDDGHSQPHPMLWNCYEKLLSHTQQSNNR